jgi:magnesium transporter
LTTEKLSNVRDLEARREWLLSHDSLIIAEELGHLEPTERATAFRLLPRDKAQEVFQDLDVAYQEELLEELRSERVRELLEHMEPDDRARLLDEMPVDVVNQLLTRLSPRERELTSILLGYPEESAGRIMSPAPEFVRLHPTMTVAEAMAEIRKQGPSAETIYILPVVEKDRRLAGTIELGDLVLARPDESVGELMDKEIHSVRADDDQEIVARLIQSMDLLAVPVVDREDRFIGMVTVDDAMDILEYEESEDVARTGATEPLGRPYFSVSILRVAQSRVIWLSALAIAATLTVNVLNAFEQTLETVVSLALFIPLLIGIGGNTGAQSATTVIRAMAVGDVRQDELFKVIFRESRVGLLLGGMLAVLGFAPVWLFAGHPLALVVSLTLVAICTLAALVCSMTPVLARRIGVDPALVSAPFVTTIVDATGLLVYFIIAQMVLQI